MAEPTTDDLTVRLPRQRRSREAWARVLDAGVALLEEGGYEAFTIGAVCARAGVAPPAIYARTATKEALFLAVYEHGIARMQGVEAAVDPAEWTALGPAELVRAAVSAVAGGMLEHRRFLGAVVLISAAHTEVRQRGSSYSRALGESFVEVLSRVFDAVDHAEPEQAAWSCFSTVFSATVIRVAYGAEFGTAAPVDDATFVAELAETAVRSLLAVPR